jgi:tetratricopeptide (TPR) repeat protein
MPGLTTAPRTRAIRPIIAGCVAVVACAVLIWGALVPPKHLLEFAAQPVPRAASAPVARGSAPESEPELLPPLVLAGRSYGPRTEPSLRAVPAPRLGAERFARGKPVAPAPHQVVPAVAFEPAVAPEPRVALAGALQPPIELPPIPDVKPVIPPLPGIKDLPKVAEQPAPKPDAPGGANLLPLPGAVAQPGAPEALPVPRLDAPRGNPLLAVPGVAVPVAPPILKPLPRPALPKGDSPAVAVAQEKLPQPKPLDIPAEAAVRLGRARNAVKAGDLPLALAEFEQYLTLVPADHAVREELAGVYTQAERFASAAAAYQELIRLNPAETAKYLLPLSDLQARMKEFRTAIASLRRALELLPADEKSAAQRLDTAARLARTHLFDDDLPFAFAVVEEYLAALRPGDANVPIRFVSFLLDLERAKDAAPFLEPFLRNLSDTPEPEILVNNVRLYALLNDKRRAYDAIELLATKLPKHLGSRVQLAENLIGTEDYDLATVVFNQIPALRPNHVPSQLALVRMLLRQFKLTQAKAILETLRPVGTEQIAEASLARGQYHAATGQYAEAKYFFLDVLRQFPTDPDARLGLAATHEAARDLENAKAEYAKLPPSSRGWRRARRGLAAVLADQRQVPQALEMLTALQREAPWDHQTLVAHARVARRNGYAAQAVENLGEESRCSGVRGGVRGVREGRTAEPREVDCRGGEGVRSSRVQLGLLGVLRELRRVRPRQESVARSAAEGASAQVRRFRPSG